MHGAKGGGPATIGGVAARETRLCLFHFSQGFLSTLLFILFTVVLASTVVIVGYCRVAQHLWTQYWSFVRGQVKVFDFDTTFGFLCVPRFQWIPLQFLKTSVWK